MLVYARMYDCHVVMLKGNIDRLRSRSGLDWDEDELRLSMRFTGAAGSGTRIRGICYPTHKLN